MKDGMGLLNEQTINESLMREAEWAWSHGADGSYLGMGLFYYSLVYVHRAGTAVCLGSGGGFVPRLMRQAQRDLGLAEASRTILVDANKPEAGWGAPRWTSPDSFFRRAFQDVELVNATTQEAAENYFAPRSIVIDYLHIDADHSFEGYLKDFKFYRPFLTAGSVVTLHDSNFAGAGVSAVLEYLRTRGDCEVLDFPNLGCGTAVVRITADRPDADAREYGESDCALKLTRKADCPILVPPGIEWKYLESEAFSMRSVIAANFLRECRTVVEIGGGKSSIERFLHGQHQHIFVIDPFLREQRLSLPGRESCKVWHVRARFQDLEWTIQRPRGYGMVMLGFEMQDPGESDYQLFRLVDNSQITIIEFSSSWELSRKQYEAVRQNTSMRERLVCKLDLQGNDVGSLEGSWPPRFDREIHVLEPANKDEREGS
jgi:hypothetical protein